MKVVEIEVKEFEKFVKKQKMDNFLQSPEMYSRYRKIGKEAYLFGGFAEEKKKLKTGKVVKSEKLVIAALCVKMREKLGKKVYNMPRGPIWDVEASDAQEVLRDFLEGVEGILRDKGGMVLQVSPSIWRKRVLADEDEDSNVKVVDGMVEEEWDLGEKIAQTLTGVGFKDLGEYEQIKWAYILDLKDKTADELLENCRYGHRRSIKAAKEKYGVSVRELDDQELGVLKHIIEQTGERRGFRDPELEYYKSMKQAFSDKAQFMVAEWGETDKKKIPIVAAMFLSYGKEKVYLFSGSDTRYKKFSGSHLMQWEAINAALNDGLAIYNFHGTHPIEFAGERGVYKFKRGFRGEFIEYVGTFAKPLNLLGKAYLSRIKYAKYREMS